MKILLFFETLIIYKLINISNFFIKYCNTHYSLTHITILSLFLKFFIKIINIINFFISIFSLFKIIIELVFFKFFLILILFFKS
jgi:hypothetical protein